MVKAGPANVKRVRADPIVFAMHRGFEKDAFSSARDSLKELEDSSWGSFSRRFDLIRAQKAVVVDSF